MNEQSKLRLTKNEQILFLNSSRLGGLQSCSFDNNFPYTEIRYMGMQSIPYAYDGNRVGTLGVSKLLGDKDYLWNMTGSGFNGFLLTSYNNTNQNIGFTSGYLTNYSFRANLGQIPEIEAQITYFGDFGGLSTLESSGLTRDIYIASQTPTGNFNYMSLGPVQVTASFNVFDSISGYNSFNILKAGDTVAVKTATNLITGVATGALANRFIITGVSPLATELGYAYKREDFKTIGPGSFQINITGTNISGNPIQSCNFDINFPLLPVYTIGNLYPDTILFNKFPKVNLTLELIVNDYVPTKITKYPLTGLINTDNVLINLVDYNPPYNTIQSYSLGNMFLVSERYNQSNDSNSKLILNYSNYLI